MTTLKVAVTDRDGWRQEMTLDKAILHLGSDLRNDVVLNTARGGGVSPRHLQLITVTPNRGLCRLVNVGDSDVLIGMRGEKRLPPRNFMDVAATEQLRLGDFIVNLLGLGQSLERAAPGPASATLVPSPPASLEAAAPVVIAATAEAAADPALSSSVVAQSADDGLPETSAAQNGGRASRFFSLSLSLPQTTLEVDGVLTGTLTLQHQGDKTGVQFRLDVEGLEPEFYEIGPGPILYPNGQKEVIFRVRHLSQPRLPAGRVRFRVTATAPGAYPGEAAVVSQTLSVQPFFRHHTRLSLVD